MPRIGDTGIGLAAIQTVFEGSDGNTFDCLRENHQRYGLRILFGHAVATAGAAPTIMEGYRSGGTPWFVENTPDGLVAYDGFRLETFRPQT